MALAERAGDVESRLDAQRLLADALAALGRPRRPASALARDGLAEARAHGLRRIEGVFLNALSFIAELQDDQVAGLALDQQDLPIWRELGDRQGESDRARQRRRRLALVRRVHAGPAPSGRGVEA